MNVKVIQVIVIIAVSQHALYTQSGKVREENLDRHVPDCGLCLDTG